MSEQNHTQTQKVDDECWEVKCWKLAKAGNQFEVAGGIKGHNIFFDSLCSDYDFTMKVLRSKVVFIPVNKPKLAIPKTVELLVIQ